MKMQDDLADRELETFFSELKKNDRKIELPPFPKEKKSFKWDMIPFGVAASILVAMWYFVPDKPDYELDQDVIIITLDKGENQELQFKIETTTSLDSWEAPSSSLLTEF